MSETYVSLSGEGSGRYEEKKSFFIAFAKPIVSEADALGYLNSIRAKYPDARHHVYAYVLREGNKTRYSDDGEPSGTGGMPVLDLLRKAGITDAVIVVVRYFGGILLGTGGLVRAYSTAAKEALQNAIPAIYYPADILKIQIGYADYQKIVAALQAVTVTDTVYEDDITVTLTVDQTQTEAFVASMTAQTSGRVTIMRVGKTFCRKLR